MSFQLALGQASPRNEIYQADVTRGTDVNAISTGRTSKTSNGTVFQCGHAQTDRRYENLKLQLTNVNDSSFHDDLMISKLYSVGITTWKYFETAYRIYPQRWNRVSMQTA